MQTKPYNLQAPEAIAKEYGGNKQAIARAAQSGLVDPTAAVLAGMFIDRMRNAAAQEQVPQQTVAQQVLSPQPQQAPVGLGATPAAQQMPAPDQMGASPAMAGGGLTDLPVSESMFPDEYAGGGIVAFAGGGVPGYRTAGSVDLNDLSSLINLQQEADPFYSGTEAPFDPYAKLRGLEDYFLERRKGIAAPEREAMRKYYKEELPERLKKQKEENLYELLTKFGLGMAASSKPTFLQAAGESAGKLTPDIGEMAKARRTGEETARKGRYELEKVERAEQMDALKAAETYATKEMERTIAAGKPTDMRSYIADFVSAAKLDPKNANVPEAVLRQQGADRYLALYGAAQARGTAAGLTATTAAARESTQDYEAAAKIIDPMIARGGSKSKEYRNILQKDGQAAADKFREGLIQAELQRMRGGRGGPATGGGALPPGLPAGSVQIGTSGGKPVYRLPNGDTVVAQ